MRIYLSPREKKILQLALEKGFLTHQDLLFYYKSFYMRKDTIRRFLEYGLITESKLFDRFEIIPEKIKKILED